MSELNRAHQTMLAALADGSIGFSEEGSPEWDIVRIMAIELIEFRARASSPDPASVSGWLIERQQDGRPHWLTCAWEFGWTDDADNAIRFFRRQDAEQIASMMENEDVQVTEHLWIKTPMLRSPDPAREAEELKIPEDMQAAWDVLPQLCWERELIRRIGKLNAQLSRPDPAREALVGAALEDVYHLMPGWREAIGLLEDYCSEPVRLKNMLAALDQIDTLYPQVRAALAEQGHKGATNEGTIDAGHR